MEKYLPKTTKHKNVLIGYATLSDFNWIKGVAQISTMIDEWYQNIGFGTLINNGLLEYCFNELNLAKIYSLVRVDNKNIPERVKFQLVRNIDNHDYYYNEILRADMD